MPGPSVTLQLRNVDDEPLGEPVDILLRHQATGEQKKVQKVAAKTINVTGLRTGVYAVQIDPPSYRAVGAFKMVGTGKQDPLRLVFPIDPQKVIGLDAPAFAKLPGEASRVLAASAAVKNFAGLSGQSLYDALDAPRKAGFLNILTKAATTVFDGGRRVTEFLVSVTEMRGDRIFAVVHEDLKNAAATSVHSGLFHPVDDALHPPPPDYEHAGSYKTADHYGNLQLTLFTNGTDWLADIDIDDAQGVEHVFQVVRNEITNAPTNPYDIHEILVAHQKLVPGYGLKI